MKKNLFKRGMAGLLSLVMCLTALVGIGTTTAYAAGERAEVYLVSFPRSGDANIDYSGTWGHPNLRYMNGWHSGESKYTTIRAMHSYDGNICYCIEPGVQQDTGDTYTSKDETFWDKTAAKADKEADRAEPALSKEKSKTPEPNRQTVHTQPKKHKKSKER